MALRNTVNGIHLRELIINIPSCPMVCDSFRGDAEPEDDAFCMVVAGSRAGRCYDMDNRRCKRGDEEYLLCLPNSPTPPPSEVQASCNDGVLNGYETDVDCGGSCEPCADNKLCMVDSDCSSPNGCLNPLGDGGSCLQSDCVTDTDCPSGDKCNTILGCYTCFSDSDCGAGEICAPNGSSNVCITDPSTQPPTFECNTVDDCGPGQSCVFGNCVGFISTPSPVGSGSCGDGALNGDETDVDCGGSCEPCSVTGAVCLVDSDCTSRNGCLLFGITGICVQDVCTANDLSNCPDGTLLCDTMLGCRECVTNDDCDGDSECFIGMCGTSPPSYVCDSANDCDSGYQCQSGTCVFIDPTSAPSPATTLPPSFPLCPRACEDHRSGATESDEVVCFRSNGNCYQETDRSDCSRNGYHKCTQVV